jgi:hypothetical protein
MKLKLSAVGPCIVYSSDMTPKNCVVYKMPLAVLDKDQELEFVAIAKMGRGIEHAKFSPGLIFYRYSEDIEKEDSDEDFREMVEDSKKNGAKEINLFIESWGQINGKDILMESFEMLNKEIKELMKKVK